MIESISSRKNRIVGRYVMENELPSGMIVPHAVMLFDATNQVLALDLDSIRRMTDDSDESDAIGALSGVQWNGPFSVEIEEGIKAFFGVESLDQITGQMLDRAVNRPEGDAEVDVIVMFIDVSDEEDEDGHNEVMTPMELPAKLNVESGEYCLCPSDYIGGQEFIQEPRLRFATSDTIYRCECSDYLTTDQNLLTQIINEQGFGHLRQNRYGIKLTLTVNFDLSRVSFAERERTLGMLAENLQDPIKISIVNCLYTIGTKADMLNHDMTISPPQRID